MPRGSRGAKRGRLQWKKSAASRGRKGGMGKRKKFDNNTWKQVQTKLRRTRTAVIPPAEGEAGTASE